METDDSDYQNLEKLVQKHEAAIRGYIRTEQQLRLYIESMENEELEKKKLIQFQENEILSLQAENSELSKKVAELELNLSQS